MKDLIDLGYVAHSYCYGVDTYYKTKQGTITESINIDFNNKRIWLGGYKEELTFDEIEAISEMIKDK